ncbi:hypothetical protein GCM10010315_25950 [Streptomyces luteosporeus]|uniref:Uncharacterized protein n=1 Tax=Streptomyces luteosporeus TaxID=173856 RepID=A0ABP6G748_9ACTN
MHNLASRTPAVAHRNRAQVRGIAPSSSFAPLFADVGVRETPLRKLIDFVARSHAPSLVFIA